MECSGGAARSSSNTHGSRMRHPLRHRTLATLFLSCTVLPAACAAARQSSTTASTTASSTALTEELRRLGTSTNELMTSMPSFTCDETASSQELRDGKLSHPVKMAGVVRAVRQPGALTERYDYKHDHLFLFLPKMPPLFVSGGFATALGYFLPSAQECYRYSLSGNRVDFIARSEAATPRACEERGLKGFALLDASGNVSHIERTLPSDIAKRLKLAAFASVDLAPVSLDGRMYQLSQHIIAEMPVGNATGRFEATYTHCHRFSATVTLGASSEVSSGGSSQP